MPMPPDSGAGAGRAAGWAFAEYGAAGIGPVTTGAGSGFVGGVPVNEGGGVSQPMPPQLGDPLTGTYLDQLWDWDRLNMDLSEYSMPQYGL